MTIQALAPFQGLRLLAWQSSRHAPAAAPAPAMPSDALSLSDAARRPVGGNMLKNGSFEGGHYAWRGVGELSVPHGWDFACIEPNDPSYGTFSWLPEVDRPFRRPEARVLHKQQLPAHEHAAFVPDGEHTFKVFTTHGPTAWELKQRVDGLVPGQRYRFTIQVHQDIVERYDGGKRYPGDPHAAEVRLGVSSGGRRIEGPWHNGTQAPFGQTVPITIEFVADGPSAELSLAGKAKWAFANNGWFVDGARLEAI